MSIILRKTMINPTKACGKFVRNNCNLNNIEKKAKVVVGASLLGLWGVQTKLEVNRAQKEDKKNVFINNLIIGSVMILGGVLGHLGFKKYATGKVAPAKFKEKFFESLSIPAGAGTLGGVGGELAQRFFPLKYDNPEKIVKKTSKLIDYKYGRTDNIYEVPGTNIFDSLHPSFSTATGFVVGKEEGVKNKVKKFTYEIISGVLVPTSVILPLSSYLDKKIPNKKGLKGIINIGAGMVATFGGKTVANWFNNKVTDKVLQKQLWEEIVLKQRDLIKSYMLTNNPQKKREMLQQVENLQKIGNKIKKSNADIRKVIPESG